MRIFAVVNQKGGCGKTTTAINLAGVFAHRGFRTLLVDMDPQGHCAAGLAIPEQRVDLNIGDAMLADEARPFDPNRLLWRVMRNLDLAPSTLRLAGLEASRGDLASKSDAESRLKKVLKRFTSQYDVCLIDCSPAIGLLAFNALVAADEVIIPVETGFFSLQGASKQVNTIKSLGKKLGVSPVHRLLATIHDAQSALSIDLLDELRRRFANRVIPVVIRQDHALREAASFGQPVIEYAPDSTGSADYSALADWLIQAALRPVSASDRVGDDEHTFTATSPAESSSLDHAQTVSGVRSPEAAPRSPLNMPEIRVVPGVVQMTLATHAHPGKLSAQMAPDEARQFDLSSRAADLASIARRLATPLAPASESRVDAADPSNPAAQIQPHQNPQSALLSQPTQTPSSCGVFITDRGVLFRQPISLGNSVAVSGDFNAWSADRAPLTLNPVSRMLEALLPLPPGAYQYRLVVDGAWIADAFNPQTATNPFGGINSVLVVPGISASETHTRVSVAGAVGSVS